MTKEQLEELAAHVKAGKLLRAKDPNHHIYVIDGDAYDRLSDLATRAVEERQRLQGALRAADRKAMWQAEQWAEAGGSGGPEMRDYLEAKEALKAAIAFAEEEAKP